MGADECESQRGVHGCKSATRLTREMKLLKVDKSGIMSEIPRTVTLFRSCYRFGLGPFILESTFFCAAVNVTPSTKRVVPAETSRFLAALRTVPLAAIEAGCTPPLRTLAHARVYRPPDGPAGRHLDRASAARRRL